MTVLFNTTGTAQFYDIQDRWDCHGSGLGGGPLLSLGDCNTARDTIDPGADYSPGGRNG